MIRVSLQLIQNLFEVPLPSAIAEWAAADKQSESIVRHVEQRLFSGDANTGEPISTDPLFRAAMDSKRDRAVYWWHSIFRPTPLEWAMVPLPDWLRGLYYPLRLGRLLVKHAASSLNALHTGSRAQPR
jgi:hypothetical protein